MTDWLINNALTATILAAVVLTICRLRKPSPAARHILWLTVIIALLTPRLFTWPWTLDLSPLARSQPTTVETEPAHTSAQTRSFAFIPVDPVDPHAYLSASAASTQNAAPRTAPHTTTPAASFSTQLDPIEPQPASSANHATPFNVFTPLRFLITVWILGSAVMAAWLLLQALLIARLLRSAHPANQQIIDEAAEVAASLGIKTPRILSIHRQTGPAVYALGKPILVWPSWLNLQLDPETRRAVLTHELAHIKRNDHYTGWLDALAACVWWPHPIYWLARKQLHDSAELAADAYAASSPQTNPRKYAEALITVVERLSRTRGPLPATAAAGRSRKLLERRLRMIMHPSHRASLTRSAALGALLLTLASAPGWAQLTPDPATQPAQPPQPTAPQSTQDPAAIPSAPSNSPDIIQLIQSTDAKPAAHNTTEPSTLAAAPAIPAAPTAVTAPQHVTAPTRVTTTAAAPNTVTPLRSAPIVAQVTPTEAQPRPVPAAAPMPAAAPQPPRPVAPTAEQLTQVQQQVEALTAQITELRNIQAQVQAQVEAQVRQNVQVRVQADAQTAFTDDARATNEQRHLAESRAERIEHIQRLLRDPNLLPQERAAHLRQLEAALSALERNPDRFNPNININGIDVQVDPFSGDARPLFEDDDRIHINVQFDENDFRFDHEDIETEFETIIDTNHATDPTHPAGPNSQRTPTDAADVIRSPRIELRSLEQFAQNVRSDDSLRGEQRQELLRNIEQRTAHLHQIIAADGVRSETAPSTLPDAAVHPVEEHMQRINADLQRLNAERSALDAANAARRVVEQQSAAAEALTRVQSRLADRQREIAAREQALAERIRAERQRLGDRVDGRSEDRTRVDRERTRGNTGVVVSDRGITFTRPDQSQDAPGVTIEPRGDQLTSKFYPMPERRAVEISRRLRNSSAARQQNMEMHIIGPDHRENGVLIDDSRREGLLVTTTHSGQQAIGLAIEMMSETDGAPVER